MIKASPGITITGEWLKSEINKCLYHLQKTGFYVRAVISDDHASNVRAFKHSNCCLIIIMELIYHPAYNETLKTYLFFDIVQEISFPRVFI